MSKRQIPRHAEDTAHTDSCQMRAWESSELAKWTAENPCPSCAWEPVDRDPCMSCLESVLIGTGILVLSPTLISLGCYSLCKVSSTLLILDNASFLLLLYLMFLVGTSVLWVKISKCAYTWACYCSYWEVYFITMLWSQLWGLCWEWSIWPHTLPGKCSTTELQALPTK